MPNTLIPPQETTIDPNGSIFLGDIESRLSSDQRATLQCCGACLMQRVSPAVPNTRMCAAEADRRYDSPSPVTIGWMMARISCRQILDAGGVTPLHGYHQ